MNFGEIEQSNKAELIYPIKKWISNGPLFLYLRSRIADGGGSVGPSIEHELIINPKTEFNIKTSLEQQMSKWSSSK